VTKASASKARSAQPSLARRWNVKETMAA
jgi:hypothetical protein